MGAAKFVAGLVLCMVIVAVLILDRSGREKRLLLGAAVFGCLWVFLVSVLRSVQPR